MQVKKFMCISALLITLLLSFRGYCDGSNLFQMHNIELSTNMVPKLWLLYTPTPRQPPPEDGAPWCSAKTIWEMLQWRSGRQRAYKTYLIILRRKENHSTRWRIVMYAQRRLRSTSLLAVLRKLEPHFIWKLEQNVAGSFHYKFTLLVGRYMPSRLLWLQCSCMLIEKIL